MSDYPTDLVPLNTSPYAERPDDLPLDREEVRTALWRTAGNITKAAELLKVPAGRLRNFIRGSAYLMAEMDESREQIVDEAERVVLEELRDPDKRGAMARFILSGQRGKARGYGAGSGSVNVNNTSNVLQIVWEDGQSVTASRTIDHE